MALFSHREFTDALALVSARSLLRDRTAPFGRPVLDLLRRLVPGVVGYHEREVRSHHMLTACETSDRDPPLAAIRAAAEFCGEYPLSIQLRSHEQRALRISDFVTCMELHRLDYYQQALRPMGVERQIRMWLPAPPRVARCFCVDRSRCEGDLGERDSGLLQLLRPSSVASRERLGGGAVPSILTSRESGILDWVARSKTNKEIAALLVVSPNTVRKHLEQTFEKLHVHTRTAAVSRALAAAGNSQAG